MVFEELEPDELEVEVVIGRGLGRDRIEVVKGMRVEEGFDRHSESAADVLSEPAGEDLVAKLVTPDRDDVRSHGGLLAVGLVLCVPASAKQGVV